MVVLLVVIVVVVVLVVVLLEVVVVVVMVVMVVVVTGIILYCTSRSVMPQLKCVCLLKAADVFSFDTFLAGEGVQGVLEAQFEVDFTKKDRVCSRHQLKRWLKSTSNWESN